MEFKDYYSILGVDPKAADEDIKRAYRRLARKYHPDVSKESDAELRFKEMKEAYEVLKDPEKRTAYDQLREQPAVDKNYPPPGWDRDFSFSDTGFENTEGFSDFFETLFGRGRAYAGGFQQSGRRRSSIDGSDVSARIAITLEEAYAGSTRQVSLDVPEFDAQGRVSSRRRTLKVRIPAGIRAGQRIRLADQGEAGIGDDAVAGDLYLQIEYAPHPVFEARQRDIEMMLPVTPSEAALGRTVKTPTLGGPVDLKIPPGSASGRRLRLKGRGLPGKPPGDQYVELRIVVPKKLDTKSRELYEELERCPTPNPRAALGI